MIFWAFVTLSRLLLLFLPAVLALQGYVRSNRERSTAHSMDGRVTELSAVLLLAVMPGRVLQQEFPSGGDFEVYSALYSSLADGQLVLPHSLKMLSA